MTEPLNKHCFLEPHWRVIAQGFQTETWFNDGQAIGTGGIHTIHNQSIFPPATIITDLPQAIHREKRSWGVDGGWTTRTIKRSKPSLIKMVIPSVMLLA